MINTIVNEKGLTFKDFEIKIFQEACRVCREYTVVRHINLGSIRHFKLVENNIKQFTQHINLCFFCALF